MKIGEAGEAFFVFETDDDIPEDLITSPLLGATTPVTHTPNDTVGKFSTKLAGIPNPTDFDIYQEPDQEPDFLDLDATPKDSEMPSDSAIPLPEPSSLPTTASSLLARTGANMEKVDNLKEGKIRAPEVLYRHGEIINFFAEETAC